MTRGRWLWLCAVLPLCAACDGANKPGPKDATDEVKADPKKARQLIVMSDDAREASDFDKARELLAQADRYADTAAREEIRVARELCDKNEVKSLAPEIVEAAQEGRCQEALEHGAKLADKRPGVTFGGFVRAQVSRPIAECIENLVGGGKLAEARELQASAAAKKALDAESLQSVSGTIADAVRQEIMKQLEEPMARHAWAEALEKLDALVAAGSVGAEQAAGLVEQVRAGIGDDIKAAVAAAAEKKKATAEDLALVDALIAAGRWAPPIVVVEDDRTELEKIQDRLTAMAEGQNPDAPPPAPAEADKGKPPLPAELDQARGEMAFWVACTSLKCKLDGSTRLWTFGAVPLSPKGDPKGKPVKKLPHAVLVTRLATAGGLSLVEYQPVNPRFSKRVGWADAKSLRADSTADLLPPASALVGVRVWGPLRDGEKRLELGTVVAATGEEATVRRMSDAVEVPMKRSKLGLARLPPGTKVLALCMTPGKLEAALVEAIQEPTSLGSDPIVTLQCVDDDGKPVGDKRQEQLGAVRLDPRWLP